MEQKERHLYEVSEEELRQAVVLMCRTLGLSGGSAAGYDLYEAVRKERLKSIEFQRNKQASEQEL
jgi:hypothetical protein